MIYRDEDGGVRWVVEESNDTFETPSGRMSSVGIREETDRAHSLFISFTIFISCTLLLTLVFI
jgi:hypothetical protein